MSDLAIEIINMGKMYKLFRRPSDKIMSAFGLDKYIFWKQCQFQEFWALREINMGIKKGERLGIIGRNGAGKSTLLKIIAGNIQPTEGLTKVNGRLQALLELGTGFHPEFTGRQNIRAALGYQGLSPKLIDEKEEEIIDFAELEEFIDQPLKTYSAGMSARLAFSTATSVKPDILIIDEILGAGDAYFTGKCVERMHALTGEGATVIFVSHDLSSVQMFCDRLYWFDRGRIRAEGDPLPIIKAYMAEVRKEEEIRLRARDLRIHKKRLTCMENKNELYRPLLFHFVVEADHPFETHPIFSAKLKAGNEEVGIIQIGDAMDNSEEYQHYILDAKGYMDWGPPVRVENSWCREYKNCGGVYKHAPFQFALPRTMESEQLCLSIGYKETCNETVYIEFYDGEKYRRIGRLEANSPSRVTIAEFVLCLDDKSNDEVRQRDALIIETDKIKENANISNTEIYGSKEIEISNFELLDRCGRSQKVFTSGEKMIGRFYYQAYSSVTNPTFVVCVYRAEGFCATQSFIETKDLNLPILNGAGTIDVIFDPLLLGQGDYVISLGIFKYCRLEDRLENPAYCVWDRSVHLRIKQPEEVNKDLGYFLHPVKWTSNI